MPSCSELCLRLLSSFGEYFQSIEYESEKFEFPSTFAIFPVDRIRSIGYMWCIQSAVD